MNETTKQKIKFCLEDYLNEIAKKGTNGLYFNPTYADSKASLSLATTKDFCTDFGINKHYDIFSLYAEINGLDIKRDFKRISEELANKYNITLDKSTSPREIKEQIKETEQREQKDLTSDYKKWNEELNQNQEAKDYLTKKRFIKEHLINKYNIGFNKEHNLITIPCTPYYYKGRSINDQANIKHYNPKGVNADLWNKENLKDSTKETIIFICESITDALSLESAADVKTIALNSTAYKDKLITEAAKNNYKGIFILCLDGDETGRQASIELKHNLKERGFFSYIFNKDAETYGTECKDFNELLQHLKDAEALKPFIAAAEEDAKTEYKKYLLKDITPTSEYLEQFEKDIRNNRLYNPIKTDITNLDKALNGGLYPKNVIILTADTSTGKTALTLQIADSIAKRQPVLYFSLEMSQSDLIARSLSRYMNEWQREERGGEIYTQTDILRGKMFNGNNAALLDYEDAKKNYAADVKDNLIIYECLEDKENTITAIIDKIKNYIAKTEQKPVVFIDYLQYIDADLKSGTDKQATDKIIRELKRTASLFEIPIFALSSKARNFYNTETTLDSGKNSGDIEFTADVMIGLNLQAVAEIKKDSKGKISNESRQMIKEASRKSERKMYITILKNRNGRRDIDIKGIIYEPKKNTFNFNNSILDLCEDEE